METNLDIDLGYIFKIIKKKIKIILLIGIICGIISGLISFFVMKPVYQADMTLIVNKQVDNEVAEMSTNDDFTFAQKMAVTYGEIIKSRAIMEEIINNMKLDTSYEKLIKNISVKNIDNTQIIKISVQNTNPKTAMNICNNIPNIFEKEVQRITKASGIEIIDKAKLPKKPIKPNKIINILVATFLGIIISTFIILTMELLDKNIKTTKDVEEKLGLTVLSTLAKEKKPITIVKNKQEKSNKIEEFVRIRTNIEYLNVDDDLKKIIFTSTNKNEGKSVITSNVAYSFSNLENKKILLIDCDLRNPSIHKVFKVSNLNGLIDILVKGKSFDECKISINKNLDILTVGKIPPNPSEILSSKKMKRFIEMVSENYDYVFIDTPPIGAVSDASILASYTDKIIYVISSGDSEEDQVKNAMKCFKKDKVLGVVLNKVDSNINGYYSYGYY